MQRQEEARIATSGESDPPWALVDAAFVVVALSLLGTVGWLAEGTTLDGPLVTEGLPRWGGVAFGMWMANVAVFALVLPILALVAWGRHESVRAALLPYVLVLGAQVGAEMTFVASFAPNVVVLTGIVFTLYRLLRLRVARREFAGTSRPVGIGRSVVGGLLTAGLVLWAANFAFLLGVALPRVLF